MNTVAREIVSRLASRARAAPMIAAALLVIAPPGVLVSQEAPKPTTPEQSQPAAKKTGEPAAKPAATKPGSDATKPATASAPEPAAESENDSADGEPADAPKRFIPSQKSSADNSATFPIDI